MASCTKIDLLGGKVSSFEEFFTDTDVTKSLDFNMLLDAVGSVPLYKQLGIEKDLLSSDELNQMDLEAMENFKIYQDKLKIKQGNEDSNLMNSSLVESEISAGERLECQLNDLRIAVNDDTEDKGSAERFLKFLYNAKESDLLVTTLQKNINFDIHPKSPEKSIHDKDMNSLTKDMEMYLADIVNGKYDDFPFRHPSPIPSSSESESDEEVTSKAREFSSKFKMPTNTNKFDFLKSIVDDSLKKGDYLSVEKEKLHFHPPKWISSDDEPEMEGQNQRANDQEVRRKKKKGLKSRNKTNTQSKQNEDKTTQQEQDNTFQQQQYGTARQKQNDTSLQNQDNMSQQKRDNTSRQKQGNTSQQKQDNTCQQEQYGKSRQKRDNASRQKRDNASRQKQDNTSRQNQDNMSQQKRDNTSRQNQDNMSQQKRDNTSRQKQDNTSRQKQDNAFQQKQDNISQRELDGTSQQDQRDISQQKRIQYSTDELKQINSNLFSLEPNKDVIEHGLIMKDSTKSNPSKKKSKEAAPKVMKSSNTTVCEDKPKQQKFRNKQKSQSKAFIDQKQLISNQHALSTESSTPEKQKLEPNHSLSSSTPEEHIFTIDILENKIVRIQFGNIKEPESTLPDVNQSTSDNACIPLNTTIDSRSSSSMTFEQKKLNKTSSSSDEDWAAYAERGLSAVDKILKSSSKKLP